MKAHVLQFVAPGQVDVVARDLAAPGPDEAVVAVRLSAISAGTEMLVYRGQFPRELALDANLAALSGGFQYPLSYGYAAVGEVIAAGANVAAEWEGRRVFAFQPHASHFVAPVASLIPIPDGVAWEAAVFLPNLETAVNLVMDGQPSLGERVLVLGQGVVGLLTTALLARFPLTALVAADRYPARRQAAAAWGATAVLDPDAPDFAAHLGERLAQPEPSGADLVFELSGAPAALDTAIAAAGFSGRVVIGSWYGEKRAPLDLGGWFHRSRIRLISSQVSTLAPQWTGRWTKARRFALVWEQLGQIAPQTLITQRFDLHNAAAAYNVLDQQPHTAIQIVLTPNA
jgi:2-desacetyl-2-hydroxyethyl bacteriochlorophyllide A dehydrogenase